MKTRALPSIALALTVLLAPPPVRAGHRNLSIDHGRDPVRCSDISMEFDERPATRGEERVVYPVEAGRPLKIQILEHSGAHVRGTDRSDFEVLVCKAAESAEDLSAIALSRTEGTVTVRGPRGGDWVGYLLIAAPKTATMELSASNGPVALTGLSGHVVARSENGPISVRNSFGDLDLSAENGPIDVRGGGGRMRLATENGPIGVALAGTAWNGAGLEGHAVNGPIRLAIPAGYRSGAVVETLDHSPLRCRGEGCERARRTWDDDHRRIEIGDGPALVRLSSQNGPVTVATGKDSVDDDED
ncbi:MAG: hypothetical protein WAU32_01655 [Thermoanaerobaculia bacterium]